MAADVPALLAASDGRVTVRKQLPLALAGATVERRELPLQLRLLDVLLDPNLITLLFLGGILGIAFELTHPGIVLPGLLGTVALLLALLGLSIVPFSWAGIALLVFGIALLALEGHSPAHGAFAAVGDALARCSAACCCSASTTRPTAPRASGSCSPSPCSLRVDRDVRGRPRMAGAAPAAARRRRVARGPGRDRRDRTAPERPGARARRALAGAACPTARRARASSVRVTGQQGLVLEVEREPGDEPRNAHRMPA